MSKAQPSKGEAVEMFMIAVLTEDRQSIRRAVVYDSECDSYSLHGYAGFHHAHLFERLETARMIAEKLKNAGSEMNVIRVNVTFEKVL